MTLEEKLQAMILDFKKRQDENRDRLDQTEMEEMEQYFRGKIDAYSISIYELQKLLSENSQQK